MEINDDDIFKINGPLDLTFLSKLAGIEGYDDLKGKGYTPQPAKWIDANKNIFEQIKEHDALLNHPYETFEPVIELVRQAAKDPDVLCNQADTLQGKQPLSYYRIACSGSRKR